MSKLSQKQTIFVQRYLVHGHGTQAATEAKYSEGSAHVQATRLLKNDKIKLAIAEGQLAMQKRNEVDQDRVIQEYARIAFVDPRKFINEDGTVKALNELDEDTAKAVADIEIFNEWEKKNDNSELIGTRTKIKMIDKRGALDSLGKHLGMFIERKEVGKPGDFENLTDEQLANAIREEQEAIDSLTGAKKAPGAKQVKPVPTVH